MRANIQALSAGANATLPARWRRKAFCQAALSAFSYEKQVAASLTEGEDAEQCGKVAHSVAATIAKRLIMAVAKAPDHESLAAHLQVDLLQRPDVFDWLANIKMQRELQSVVKTWVHQAPQSAAADLASFLSSQRETEEWGWWVGLSKFSGVVQARKFAADATQTVPQTGTNKYTSADGAIKATVSGTGIRCRVVVEKVPCAAQTEPANWHLAGLSRERLLWLRRSFRKSAENGFQVPAELAAVQPVMHIVEAAAAAATASAAAPGAQQPAHSLAAAQAGAMHAAADDGSVAQRQPLGAQPLNVQNAPGAAPCKRPLATHAAGQPQYKACKRG